MWCDQESPSFQGAREKKKNLLRFLRCGEKILHDTTRELQNSLKTNIMYIKQTKVEIIKSPPMKLGFKGF
jgi:hypothetical protein